MLTLVSYLEGWPVRCRWPQCQLPWSSQLGHKLAQLRAQDGSRHVSLPFEFTASLTLVRTISVTIGITVGLFASNLAIATFISAAHKIKGTPPRKTQVGSAFWLLKPHLSLPNQQLTLFPMHDPHFS
jgi:hypothetical protein